MCVCLYLYMCVSSIYICVCVFIYICVCLPSICVCLPSMCVCVFHLYVCVCLPSISLCVCLPSICVCVFHLYVCVYIFPFLYSCPAVLHNALLSTLGHFYKDLIYYSTVIQKTRSVSSDGEYLRLILTTTIFVAILKFFLSTRFSILCFF